jgi:hypothetical protein
MIVSADSSKAKLEDRLGHILIKSGRLTRDKLDECLAEQKKTLNRLGNILLKRQLVTTEALKEVLASVISQKIYPVFRWEEGEYHFSQEEDIDYDEDCFSPVKTDNFLMEAAQIMDEWPLIKSKIQCLDSVFRQKIDAHDLSRRPAGGKDGREMPAGTGGTTAANLIELTPEEQKVYDHIDGRRSMTAVVDELYEMTEFDVYRIIYDLLERNLIEPVDVEKEKARPDEKKAKRLHPALKYSLYLLLLAAVIYQGFFTRFGLTGFWDITGDPYYASWIKKGASYNRLENISHKVKIFYLNHRRFPDNLDELVSSGLARAKDKADPWGRIYAYVRHGQGFVLIGYDRAGKVDSDLVINVTHPVF